jgi:pimeloyl-ACP methyl ester carboxylesterase
MTGKTYEFDRIPITLSFDEKVTHIETYGFSGSQGSVWLEGQRLRPRGRESKTVAIFMHPATTLQLLPMPTAMAEAGIHVMCCGSRYAKNDSALIMEKVAIDMGRYIAHAREVLGYETVVLVGWSGGASLSLFYQGEAEHPSITHTPAGDPVDLTAAGLIPADGVMMIAAHASRAITLSDWVDPSVTNELDPDARELELDIYNPKNPNQPPYTAEFITRYRTAQLARIRRITGWAREMIEEIKRRNTKEHERCFVVHRTMADLRWLDPNVDPNDREPGRCYLGDPEPANVGTAGLARFSSLRSWLSQWSYDDSRASAIVGAGRISKPLLVVENSADDAAPASHPKMVYDAAPQTDREMKVIKGATHYYKGQPEQLKEALAVTSEWMQRKGLLAD